MSFDTREKSHPVELDAKAISEGDDAWHFSGYASIFNSKDLGGDVVCPGAFAQSLRDHGNPLLLFQHKQDECPVGVITEAKEDRRGLYVRGELPKDDTFVAGRLVPQLKRRGLKGMSIGYRPIESEKRKSDGARMLTKIRLYECSFVSLPMHPEAGLETIKACSSDDLDELAALMRQFSQEAKRIADSRAELRVAACITASRMEQSDALRDYELATQRLRRSQQKRSSGEVQRELISTMQLFIAEAAKLRR
jgi:HK97 family phage prohead protease